MNNAPHQNVARLSRYTKDKLFDIKNKLSRCRNRLRTAIRKAQQEQDRDEHP